MGEILDTPIIGEVEQSFLDYSLSVITDRAIPSAEDGLKPVARRILWDMWDKGYKNDKKFVKCAQPVGDTMGRFHPHGDSSIYGALVWLSQPWNMRYPLIAFHGNNGSRDGDEPAAYRYTECKLAKLGEETLNNIKKNAVDWLPAYTDEEDEPTYLPGIVPNLLVNGTSGIAVAMACSFAPHNLNEIMDAIIHVAENPECECGDLLQFVKGPDFPTGGLVINQKELAAAYLTGKGRARIRGEYEIESDKGKDSIIFTSIPYKVSKDTLVTQIDKLCDEGKLGGIAAIRDETTHEGVRFVIELEKNASANTILPLLFKLTDLETTYSFNQVALTGKSPRLMNLKQLIEVYLDHQKDVCLRVTQFDLDKAKARLHIIEGLIIALANIDDVIKIIKSSESTTAAKTALQTAYKLSEAQAKAILDMKLSRLTKLEVEDLKSEEKDLIAEVDRLSEILKNPVPELIRQFIELKKKYGDPRRTTITQIDPVKEEKETVYVEPEKCVVVMTESGLIKRIPTTSFRTQKRAGKGVKTQDDITSVVIRTNTVDSIMIFTDQGRMYRISVNDIPVGTNVSKGQSIRSLVALEANENPVTIYSIYRDTDAKYVLFVTKNGLVKKTPLDEYVATKKKTGIGAISLVDGDGLAVVTLIKDEPLIIVTKDGYVLKFDSNEVSATSRMTRGVKGIALGDGDYVIAALPLRHVEDQLALFSFSGLGKKVLQKEVVSQKRGGRGLNFFKGPNGLAGAQLISDEDSILLVGDKASICIPATDVPQLTRIALGNTVIKGSNIRTVSKV